MGRRKLFDKVIAFKIDSSLLEELEQLARALSTTRSELVRRAVREYLAGEPHKVQHNMPEVRRR